MVTGGKRKLGELTYIATDRIRYWTFYLDADNKIASFEVTAI